MNWMNCLEKRENKPKELTNPNTCTIQLQTAVLLCWNTNILNWNREKLTKKQLSREKLVDSR